MKTISSVMKTETVCNDQFTHRYLYKRVWDEKKPLLCVMTIYPGGRDASATDTTTMRIEENVRSLEKYGGFLTVNLFSAISPQIDHETALSVLCDKETDRFISQAAEEAESIVIAWGRIADTNPLAAERQESVLSLLEKAGRQCLLITDAKGRSGVHPLCPAARHWTLIPFASKRLLEKTQPVGKDKK